MARATPTTGWGKFKARLRKARHKVRYLRKSALARANRAGSSAKFIATTGSAAKSTTTCLLAHILAGQGKVRTTLDHNTVFPVIDAVGKTRRGDDYCVVEVGASGPGSIMPMASIVRPDIAIITLVGLDHYTRFRTREAVAEEKGGLVACVAPGGLALLNADDPHVMSMATRTKERIVTFARDNEADYRATVEPYRYPVPLTLTISWRGGKHCITAQLVGEHFWLSIAAAFAAAVELGVSPDVVCERIASFTPVDNRCQIYRARNGPTFMLDCYKSPWLSMALPIETMKAADVPYKRIVLSQISDFAGNPKAKYRDTYRMARDASDAVIAHGDNAHRYADAVRDAAPGQFTLVHTVKNLHDHIRQTARADELILVKGTGTEHLERVALAFDHDVKCWVERCGQRITCMQCGLYEYPREQHRAILRKRHRQRMLDNVRKFLGLKRPATKP